MVSMPGHNCRWPNLIALWYVLYEGLKAYLCKCLPSCFFCLVFSYNEIHALLGSGSVLEKCWVKSNIPKAIIVVAFTPENLFIRVCVSSLFEIIAFSQNEIRILSLTRTFSILFCLDFLEYALCH